MFSSRVCSDSRDLICDYERWDRTDYREHNRIKTLVNGEQAYPAMIEAIEAAETHVLMCTYQWDDDEVGSRFAYLLQYAKQRGVEVRVILDSWGDLKSHPSIRSRLQELGIDVRAFHPIKKILKYNRRCHRKLLLVDGIVGFTGGMNIRDRNLVESYDGNPMRDTVFKIEGPVLEMLEAVFMTDWMYCGGTLDYCPVYPGGVWGSEAVSVLGAGLPFRRKGLEDAFCQAIEGASERVVALTPFFFPTRRLLQSFSLASAHGASVEFILPTGDFVFLGWCGEEYLTDLIECGCVALKSAPPYDHSKILLVDDTVFIGTVNLDYRSFETNWEISMICRGGSLSAQIGDLVEEQRRKSTRVQLSDLRERFPKGLARKFLMSTAGRWF